MDREKKKRNEHLNASAGIGIQSWDPEKEKRWREYIDCIINYIFFSFFFWLKEKKMFVCKLSCFYEFWYYFFDIYWDDIMKYLVFVI